MGDLSTRLRRGLLRVAPIPANPNRIFCIGNDFGKHANNIGEMHPDAQVYAIERWPPCSPKKNVQFFEDNMEERWGIADSSIGFIHLGNVMQSFNNRLHIYQEAFRTLEPGAWIEIIELEYAQYRGENLLKDEYFAYAKEIRLALGWDDRDDRDIGTVLRTELLQVGFGNIANRIDNMPMGAWPNHKFFSDIGDQFKEKAISDIISTGSRVLKEWDPDAKLTLCLAARDCLNSVDRTHFRLHTVIARKPLSSKEEYVWCL
ncbi:hypothetical protein ACEPPN_005715 [Leptodophora sp. 'Broadleaf-Isolate-01']